MALSVAVLFGIIQVPAQAYDVAQFPGDGYSLSTTAAIDQANNLWVWDFNIYDGSEFSASPEKVLTDVVSYSRGGGGTCGAIKADGSLWMWGNNRSGQLGNGTKTNTRVPVKVMDHVAAVSCSIDPSYGFTAAITKDGSLWTWGPDYKGRLGTGSRNYNTEPVRPQKIMTNVCAVSCGENHAAAIKNDGSLWMWGDNQDGELGYTGPHTNSEYPNLQFEAAPHKVMDNVACVSCGFNFTAVVKKDGSLWTFGWNNHGQLGNGKKDVNVYFQKNMPTKIMDGVRTVSCGDSHMAILKNDGSLWTCGANTYGALGNGKWYLTNMVGEITDGEGTDVLTPAKIMEDVVDVSCENGASIALKKDGSYWTWGWNIRGELGYPDGDASYTFSAPGVDRVIYIQSFPRQPEYPFTPKKPPKTFTVADFSDVFLEDYCAKPVQWAVDNAITGGTSATTFSPGRACTRGEIVTFLWRAAGKPEPSGSVSPFTDVNPGDYFYKPVLWAVENNITTGSGSDAFLPRQSCTRAQAVTFLWRAKGQPFAENPGNFADVYQGAYYESAVGWAVENGITTGVGNGRFGPNGTCTRGQIVTFLYRAANVPESSSARQ